MSIIYEAIHSRLLMKRLLVLLLLVLLPLQIVWAATGACCEPGEDAAARHVCHAWQQQCDDDDDGGAGSDDSCDCCHHSAASALTAFRPDLPAPARPPQLAFDPPHYLSYIADLVPPPDPPSRA